MKRLAFVVALVALSAPEIARADERSSFEITLGPETRRAYDIAVIGGQGGATIRFARPTGPNLVLDFTFAYGKTTFSRPIINPTVTGGVELKPTWWLGIDFGARILYWWEIRATSGPAIMTPGVGATMPIVIGPFGSDDTGVALTVGPFADLFFAGGSKSGLTISYGIFATAGIRFGFGPPVKPPAPPPPRDPATEPPPQSPAPPPSEPAPSPTPGGEINL